MAVRCPTCDVAQIANPEGSTGTTGRTVQLSKMPTATRATTVRPGNILFICSQCNFEAQLAKHYVSKAIRCPGCHAPQVVAGAPPVDGGTSALEPAAGTAPASDPRFICVACGYRARIPTQYMGLAVTCPKCETAQIASPEESESPSTGDTVSITRIKTVEELPAGAHGAVPTVTQGTSGAPIPASTVLAGAAGGDKVRFTCSACGFKARIPAAYAGQSIHCPGCNATQTVLRSGQSSAAVTGNTQVISIVQTAAASPDAIAQPTNTPSRGVPILPAEPTIAPPAKPAGVIPTAAPARAQAPPPPLAKPKPVAQPPVAVVAPAPVAPAPVLPPEERLNFDEEAAKVQPSAGKVVRRNSSSGRMAAAGGKTPLPEAPTEADDEAREMAALKASLGKPKSGAKPMPTTPRPAPTAQKPEIAKPEPKVAAKSAPRVERSEESAVPQKSSSALMVVIILFMVVLLGLVGGGGYMGYSELQSLGAKLTDAGKELSKVSDELKKANEKLAQAETDAKQAKVDAETAKKKQEEESTARKVADEKAAELEKKLKEQEAKAAAAVPAPVPTPVPEPVK